MPFTDVADSARTIAATLVKHCLICRHKYFPFFTIQRFIRGVFKKYADGCCHSLSFWLKGVKLAHNDTQRVLYVQWKFDTFDFKHDQTSVVMVTLGRHTQPNVIQRHVDVALSQSDYWLLFHILFRNFCLKAFVLFKVLPFEWNALSTPFNPWVETVFVCGWPKTEPSFANLQHPQIVGLTESSSVWGTRRNHRGPNQGCKEDDQTLQWTVCRSYRRIHVSSAVTVLLRKSSPSLWIAEQNAGMTPSFEFSDIPTAFEGSIKRIYIISSYLNYCEL